MKEKIEILKEKYRKATTKAEFAEIDKQMTALATEDNAAFSEAMVSLAGETADRAEELVLREQLKDVIPAVSLAYIAKVYFSKTRQWLYQRVNGSTINGRPAKFTEEEMRILDHALKDIGRKLCSTNVSS